MITPVPSPPEVRFGAVLSASWQLFVRNWTIALPAVLAAFVVLALTCAYVAVLISMLGIAGWRAVIASPHGGDSSALAGVGVVALIGALVIVVASIVALLWAACATYGMADAAWTRGTAVLADGNAAFAARAGAVVVATIGIVGLGIVALVLALPTLFLSLLALPLVTMFVFPAAVGGRFDGFGAIGESFRLVRRFFVPSLVTWLILYAIQYGVSFLLTFAIVPLEFAAMPDRSTGVLQMPPVPLFAFSGITYVVTILLLLAYNGFRATVEVGLFRELEARPVA